MSERTARVELAVCAAWDTLLDDFFAKVARLGDRYDIPDDELVDIVGERAGFEVGDAFEEWLEE